VSCIYGIGSAESYHGLLVQLEQGVELRRDELLRRLVDIQYERNDVDFHRGTFRVRGDVVEIFPAYEERWRSASSIFGDEIERHQGGRPAARQGAGQPPARQHLPGLALRHRAAAAARRHPEHPRRAARAPRAATTPRGASSRSSGSSSGPCTTSRCSSRWASARASRTTRATSPAARGEPPPTLIDYFPKDFLLVIDESHQTIPQVGAMYRGDRARKETLVEHGFRLPSALDNRPLKFEEFEGFCRT
jgi:excinuclease ABC subunit B